MHVWISTTWIVSMNGQWQLRGITKYTPKNRPSRVRMDKANLPLQRTPNKETALGRNSNGQTEEGDQDTHWPNWHRLTQMPWIPAWQFEKQQLKWKNKSIATKDNASNAPKGGILLGFVPASRVAQKPHPPSKRRTRERKRTTSQKALNWPSSPSICRIRKEMPL